MNTSTSTATCLRHVSKPVLPVEVQDIHDASSGIQFPHGFMPLLLLQPAPRLWSTSSVTATTHCTPRCLHVLTCSQPAVGLLPPTAHPGVFMMSSLALKKLYKLHSKCCVINCNGAGTGSGFTIISLFTGSLSFKKHENRNSRQNKNIATIDVPSLVLRPL